MLTDRLEWCGLLWCFYQLFGLSFWRHPFTSIAERVMITGCDWYQMWCFRRPYAVIIGQYFWFFMCLSCSVCEGGWAGVWKLLWGTSTTLQGQDGDLRQHRWVSKTSPSPVTEIKHLTGFLIKTSRTHSFICSQCWG